MVRPGGEPWPVPNCLSANYLRELLEYDPAAGDFVWKVTRLGRGARAGGLAGATNGKGRRQIKIDQRIYGSSNLAWLWMTGEWPARLIDHIDGDPANNRWSN